MYWTALTLTDDSQKLLNLAECIDIKPSTEKPEDETVFVDILGKEHVAKIPFPVALAKLHPILLTGVDLSGSPL